MKKLFTVTLIFIMCFSFICCAEGFFPDECVFITETGSKYHKENCFYLKYSKKEVTLKYALANEYLPCKRCFVRGEPDFLNDFFKKFFVEYISSTK